MEVLIPLLLLLVLGYTVYCWAKEIYTWFDHSGWESSARPDANAKIVSFSSEKVKYIRNNAKYKTTVKFSDGYHFVTYKTKRERHFGSYTISIDEELKQQIMVKAVLAHDEAVRN